jgi:hypothetical protein
MACAPEPCSDEDVIEQYERRIEPLLTDDDPKSCNACHLSGIDLGMFVQETPCQTMACMIDLGLVDPDDASASLVLEWIARADPASELITEEVIQAELEGFEGWIEYQLGCGADACPDDYDAPCGEPAGADGCEIPSSSPVGDPMPTDDPGDCSDLTLEGVFADKVYPWRGRCYACHFDSYDGPPEEAPRWIATGDCGVASLMTMRNVIDLELVDVAQPESSLLLLKPLAEDVGGLQHGGHDKFVGPDDPAYVDFLYWIERYAECNAPP